MQSIKSFFNKYLHNAIALGAVLALLLNLIIESLGRHSVISGLAFLIEHPMVFLLNALVIFATLSTALLFRRRIFVYVAWSIAWLALGITNGVILGFRMTPFTMTDLSLLEAGLSIIPNYLTPVQIGLVIGGIVLVVLAFVLMFIFAPKVKGTLNRKKNLAVVGIIIVCVCGTLGIGVKTGTVGTFFGNLAYAYRDYGVVYCFLNTWLNTGIGKPFGYSKEKIEELFSDDELENKSSNVMSEVEQNQLPNILFLQLESFIDPTEIKALSFSQEPVPYFRDLKENYSSGHLTVPSIGAGTANTEFEILSGMSVKFFGPGEYPYKSILKEETCESMPYALRSLGYSSHAIHNHRGAFYGRNKVFSNLGFDTFTSLEYMNYVTKTPMNWARDDVLEKEILNALRSTDSHDFIYTISVQGHGRYPETVTINSPKIRVDGLETEAAKNAYEYYVEQLQEMDDFLRVLIATLENFGEDVVLIMYGDHLPALDMTDEDMVSGSTFKTEYIIWDNMGLARQEKDVTTYQLGAEVLERLGISEGTTTIYHQNHKEDASYMDNLKMLQYDMLYGKKYIYGEKNPFEPTELQMGFTPIRINEIVQVAGQYYISGEGFTPFSKVSIDGQVLDTIFLGPTILKLLEAVDPADVDKMKVSQVEKNKEILSTTE